MRKKKGIRWTGTKVLVVLLAVALLVGGVVGGTLAWLIGKSASVNNTFVVGDIGGLSLTENTEKYLIVPGCPISKDPVVTYTPKTESHKLQNVDAYIFVEVSFANGSDWKKDGDKGYKSDFLAWTVGDDWTALDASSNVYYKLVEADDTKQEAEVKLPVIKDNQITVDKDITVEDVAGETNYTVDPGDITFTAYAIQKDGMSTPAKAWETLQSSPNP